MFLTRQMSKFSLLLLLTLLLMAASCKNLVENMLPSGEDKSSLNLTVHDFTANDTTGTPFTLSTELAGKTGVVLYFTMWCPICNGHTDHMLANLVAKYPTISFVLVDYVSADWNQAWANQQANGYTLAPVTVVSDATGAISNQFNGTMGMVAVFNPAGNLILNQDYQDGATLDTVLSTL